MCKKCGATLESVSRGRPRKYCLDCAPRTRKLVNDEPPCPRKCSECESTFTPASSSRYCSTACRSSASAKSRRVPCAQCSAPIYRSRTSRPTGEATCNPCSRKGCGSYAAYRRGCRCAECRKANAIRTATEVGPLFKFRWISDAERLRIYERDNWICQLCSKPVDLSVHHLRASAPTLDHIEPRSVALIPDDRPENLRTAHRGCNSARGNRVTA